MALTVGDRPIRPLTADEVMAMVAAGILGEDDRVELLLGALTAVSPKSAEHGSVIARLVRWLIASDPDERYEVRTEHPLRVPDRTSLPEPDVVVVPCGPSSEHPTTAVLVIEVAASSLATDTEVKPALYATAGVPEYWVVDLVRREVIKFTQPADGRYDEVVRHRPPEHVRPVSVAVEAPVDLARVFSGRR
jgi:Uma2 family endonuclease